MIDDVAAGDNAGPDVDAVETLAAFAAACNSLRADRSYADLRRNASPGSLPSSTLSNLINARSIPTPETLRTFLKACGLGDASQQPWLSALERVSTGHQARPAGAVRVRDARPRLLGVHAAIQLPDVDELPPYVPRDLDADLRTAVTAAAADGGFVLLVGGSSVGKTRALLEAIRTVLAEWWLVHPADAVRIGAHAADPAPRTVLWLDELQRYLNHAARVPVGVMQQLIAAGTVVVATLWTDEYDIRTVRPEAGQPDPYANDRDVLRLAHVVRVPGAFSTTERRRGAVLAPTDRRIQIALETADAGFTQVLAAGPELIQRWEQAPDRQCYGMAVITAALDARRVGAHRPVTRAFLDAAAPAYLTPDRQATAPLDWLDQALAYATTRVLGAAACLAPVPAGMGQTAGYVTADYLHQHARSTRRTVALPDAVWQALIAHHHPDDCARIAGNAERRGRLDDAITLYHRAAIGDRYLVHQLVDLLFERGRVDEALQLLRDRADAGDLYAAYRLADVLTKLNRVDEALHLVRGRADVGDAAYRLVGVLVGLDRAEEALQLLRSRADAGDVHAARLLADRLVQQGRVGEALQLLRDRADGGDGYAANQLIGVLGKLDRVEEALQLLRRRAESGDRNAAYRLIDVLVEQDRLDEALQLLRDRAVAGDRNATHQLTDMLMQRGRTEEALQFLRDRADAGDGYAARMLGGMLAGQGRVDEALRLLRGRADAGDVQAADQLADVLAKTDRVDEALRLLRDRADAGDRGAVQQLARLLIQRGGQEQAVRLLRDRADAGDGYAAQQLSDLLRQLGRKDEALQQLRDRAAAGAENAAHQLADLLADLGRADEAVQLLRDRAEAGDRSAAYRLVDVLVGQGRVDEALRLLRDRADAGDRDAPYRLTDVLVEQDRVDEALQLLRDRADAGDRNAAYRLVDVLVRLGRLDDLDDEVAAGTPEAARAVSEAAKTGAV
ncbi:hypothetical protein OHA72_54495 [Dactylosporangium sp. NBC_01737]|uniref:tetratricopeptide repeat protein n=1 Tax=Dactylosporangium sp. NBC_01737 TaxID=2975959 RepID=UPI002E1244CC|nr:hypothetical protein OHA72_54495 [Dactylosporangium sp. NBC_01737]